MRTTRSTKRCSTLSTLLALVSTLFAGCGASSPVESQPEPVSTEAMAKPTFTRTHALRGPEGVRVSIAEFGQDETLFLISGSRSDMDGYALRGTVEEQGRGGLRFGTKWDGRDWYPVHKNAVRGGSVWKLYDGTHRSGLTLEYDEEASGKVDTDALYSKHVAQTQDGSLAKLQIFDRQAAEARAEEQLAAELARTEEACEATPKWKTQWSSVSDETFQRFSIDSYCENVLSALRNVCRWQPGKDFVRKHVKSIECRWGDDLALTLDGSTLKWTAADGSNLEQNAREALLKMPADDKLSLEQALDYAKTDVCQSPDGEHVLAVHPHEKGKTLGISYGTEEELFYSSQPYGLGRGWFFDPRQFRKQNNANFRGRDLRYYSRVDIDQEKQACTVACGERTSTWKLVAADKARDILIKAKSAPAPFDREPYALARDSRGVYYYVDRGNHEQTQRDFRVYKGPRGSMKRLEMRDVASDSEGEVFSTAGGELRLLVEKDNAQWVKSKKSQKLRRIPVHENYRLIMKELGVYVSQRFELPCDDY